MKIGFIGGGNMASSLIAGLLQQGHQATSIIVCEHNPTQRDYLTKHYAVQVTEQLSVVTNSANCIILAVKPQVLLTVCQNLQPLLQANTLLISIAAGVRIATLVNYLGSEQAIIRCMPNTPARVLTGMTALYANDSVTAVQREQAQIILQSVGLTLWVDSEAKLDAVTAVSGSGPAYFFLFMEALQTAAKSLGLTAAESRELCLQTALGAATMAMTSSESLAELRAQITSKGGTTEQALAVLQQGELPELIQRAVTAAYRRAVELATAADTRHN